MRLNLIAIVLGAAFILSIIMAIAIGLLEEHKNKQRLEQERLDKLIGKK